MVMSAGLSEESYLKVWQGLHFCFWMCDKPLIQVRSMVSCSFYVCLACLILIRSDAKLDSILLLLDFNWNQLDDGCTNAYTEL